MAPMPKVAVLSSLHAAVSKNLIRMGLIHTDDVIQPKTPCSREVHLGSRRLSVRIGAEPGLVVWHLKNTFYMEAGKVPRSHCNFGILVC